MKLKGPYFGIESEVSRDRVTVFHTRKPTVAERRRDRTATLMAEVVTIRFYRSKAPTISVNRDLCS